jgi:hypothetical protein
MRCQLIVSTFLVGSFSLACAQTGLLVTRAEDPSRYTTTLSNTNVLNFDTQPHNGSNFNAGWYYPTSGTGVYTWSTPTTTIGTLDRFYIKGGDQYGGAGIAASRYIVQSEREIWGGVTSNTLTLATPSAYFGLWWSAGDGNNKMTFKNGSTTVAEFTTASLLDGLPSGYYGNPRNRSLNPTEAYAFLNFFGEGTTTWDSITFTNTGSVTGFESDNWTTRVEKWGDLPDEEGPPPGVPLVEVNVTTVTVIPEPTSLFLSVGALGCMLLRRKRP